MVKLETSRMKPIRDIRHFYNRLKTHRTKSAGEMMVAERLYIGDDSLCRVKPLLDLNKYHYIYFDIQLKLYDI